MYVADRGNCLVRQINLATRAVSTLAGSSCPANAVTAIGTDGVGAFASFVDPTALTMTTTGDIYVGDGKSLRIVLVGGNVMTLDRSTNGGALAGIAVSPDGTIVMASAGPSIYQWMPSTVGQVMGGVEFA